MTGMQVLRFRREEHDCAHIKQPLPSMTTLYMRTSYLYATELDRRSTSVCAKSNEQLTRGVKIWHSGILKCLCYLSCWLCHEDALSHVYLRCIQIPGKNILTKCLFILYYHGLIFVGPLSHALRTHLYVQK